MKAKARKKKYEELWSKIKGLVRSTNTNGYDWVYEEYVKNMW